MGFSVAYGGQELLTVKYSHQTYIFKGQLQQVIFKPKPFGLNLSLSPQYGRHRYRPVDSFPDYQSSYEYGIELGLALSYRRPSAPTEWLLAFRAGPQFARGLPSRQAAGFVLGSGFVAGLNYWWQSDVALSFRTGFRHWSNAGLTQPNGGIDHVLLELGFLWSPP